jgi:hypothetical protein|tara:strand:- start:530 stop:805 length:276 start_codon:yes stop_codon:yes gene_type:complete
MEMTLIDYITEEFSPTEYDPGFIKDVVGNYKGKINLNGNLIDDNLNLFTHIWDAFVAIDHPNMKPMSVEEHSESIETWKLFKEWLSEENEK